MPKTKLESVVFSAMMVFCLVFSMTCYTGALRAGGVTYGLFILVVQGLTVSMVVPAVTLFASLLHGGVNPGFFPRWIQLAGQCFPAALILQVFYIGPLVRWLFRLLFRRNEKSAARN